MAHAELAFARIPCRTLHQLLCQGWLDHGLHQLLSHLSPGPTLHPCAPSHPQITEETEELIKIVGEGDSTKELFPLKMRDAAQAAGFAYIKSKGLIPEDDSDDYIPVSDVPWWAG
jgi:hypothetical protein